MIRRRRVAALAGAVLAVGTAVGVLVAPIASGQDGGGRIYACVSTGNGEVRIVEPDQSCDRGFSPIQWAVTGPAGPPGPPGPAGQDGVDGGPDLCPPEAELLAPTAGVEGFAEVAGIEGDSTAVGHGNSIDLLSLRAGVTGPGGMSCGISSGTATNTALDRIVLTKLADRATVPLLAASANAQTIPAVTIELEQTGDQPFVFMTYALEDVRVDRWRTVWTKGVPAEEVVLAFERVTISYVPQSADGQPGPALEFCWDIVAQSC